MSTMIYTKCDVCGARILDEPHAARIGSLHLRSRLREIGLSGMEYFHAAEDFCSKRCFLAYFDKHLARPPSDEQAPVDA